MIDGSVRTAGEMGSSSSSGEFIGGVGSTGDNIPSQVEDYAYGSTR